MRAHNFKRRLHVHIGVKRFFFSSFEHHSADPQTKSKQFKIQIIVIMTAVISKYTQIPSTPLLADLSRNSSQIKKSYFMALTFINPLKD